MNIIIRKAEDFYKNQDNLKVCIACNIPQDIENDQCPSCGKNEFTEITEKDIEECIEAINDLADYPVNMTTLE